MKYKLVVFTSIILFLTYNYSYAQVDTIANNVYEFNNNLGIGTNMPETALRIEDNVATGNNRVFIRLRNLNTGTNSSVGIGLESFDKSTGTAFTHTSSTYTAIPDFRNMGTIGTFGNGFSLTSSSNYGSLRFYTNQDANGIIERMRITADGNIGIGTKTPMFPLHLAKLEEDQSDNILFLQHGGYGSKIAQSSKGGEIELLAVDGSDIVFSSFRNSYMNVDSGNFGIGTSEPHSKLEVTKGDIYISDITKGIIMKSPDGKCWRGQVNNDGLLNFNAATCPEAEDDLVSY